MKIAFHFENESSQLILTPENARDQQYLSLCMDGKQDIRLRPTTKDCVIVEFRESQPKSIEPEVTDERPDNPGEQGLPGRDD